MAQAPVNQNDPRPAGAWLPEQPGDELQPGGAAAADDDRGRVASDGLDGFLHAASRDGPVDSRNPWEVPERGTLSAR